VTQRDIEILHERLRSQHEQLDRIEEIARQTNGRIRELELWRAKMQGVASSSRIVWLVAGAGITTIIIEVARNFPWGQ
jgi:hypothetical protein